MSTPTIEMQRAALAAIDANHPVLTYVAPAVVHALRKTEDCRHLTDDAIEERAAEDIAECFGYVDLKVREDFILLVCASLSQRRGRTGEWTRSHTE